MSDDAQLIFALTEQVQRLDEKARAVIAAGRPHDGGDIGRFPYARICPCPQCVAWDALKTVLETKQ